MFLYHYYDASMRPFRNLSDIPEGEAEKILKDIALNKPDTQFAKRAPDYMELRRYYENILRSEFLKKGGVIRRKSPHYMVVEHSSWLSEWFENSAHIKIDIKAISQFWRNHPAKSPVIPPEFFTDIRK